MTKYWIKSQSGPQEVTRSTIDKMVESCKITESMKVISTDKGKTWLTITELEDNENFFDIDNDAVDLKSVNHSNFKPPLRSATMIHDDRKWVVYTLGGLVAVMLVNIILAIHGIFPAGICAIISLLLVISGLIVLGYDATKNRLSILKFSRLPLTGIERWRPSDWVAGAVVLWIVIVPLYLIKRKHLIELASEALKYGSFESQRQFRNANNVRSGEFDYNEFTAMKKRGWREFLIQAGLLAAVIAIIAINVSIMSDIPTLEERAKPLVDQILYNKVGNKAAKCIKVKIEDKISDNIYNASAYLENGTIVKTTIIVEDGAMTVSLSFLRF